MIAVREPHGFMQGEIHFRTLTPDDGQSIWVRGKGHDGWWRATWDSNRHVAVMADGWATHERHLSAWLPREDGIAKGRALQ